MPLPPTAVIEQVIETADTDNTAALAGKLHTIADLSDVSYEQLASAIRSSSTAD